MEESKFSIKRFLNMDEALDYPCPFMLKASQGAAVERIAEAEGVSRSHLLRAAAAFFVAVYIAENGGEETGYKEELEESLEAVKN